MTSENAEKEEFNHRDSGDSRGKNILNHRLTQMDTDKNRKK
jgi:hypothetical protein